jgi:hypothetical protein
MVVSSAGLDMTKKEEKLFPAGNWATDNQVCQLLICRHRCSMTLGGVQDDSGCGGEITHIYVMHEGQIVMFLFHCLIIKQL